MEGVMRGLDGRQSPRRIPWTRAALSLVAAVVGGCGSPDAERSGTAAAVALTAPSRDTTSAELWSFAPADTVTAWVVDGQTLQIAAEHLDLLREIAKVEHDSSFDPDDRLRALSGVPGARTLQEADLDPRRGLAVFFAHDRRWVAVFPIASRARLVARRHAHRDVVNDLDTFDQMVCADRRDHYVCANDRIMLASAGDGVARIRGAWPPEVHGGVEFWLSDEAMASAGNELLQPDGPVVLAASVERGALTIRGHMPGRWRDGIATHVRAARLDPAGAAGFVVSDFGFANDELVAGTGPISIVRGITARDLARTLDGSFALRIRARLTNADVRLGLRDPSVASELIARCNELGGFLPVAAKQRPGSCRFEQPFSFVPLDVTAWIDGAALRARLDPDAGASPGDDVPLTSIGHELADGGWTLAAWGRGSFLALVDRPEVRAAIDSMQFGLVMRIDEMGFGLRVAEGGADFLGYVRWIDDRDEIATALRPLLTAAERGEQVAPRIEAIVARFPDSAFAADYKAGWHGLATPAVLAAAIKSSIVP